MTRTRVRLFAAMCLILAPARAIAGDEPAKSIPQDEQGFQFYRRIFEDGLPKPLARIYESIIDLDIDSTGIDDKELTLAEYLAAIEAKSKGKNHVSIRIDSAGLGKDADRIAATKFRIRALPSKGLPLSYIQMTLSYASKAIGEELSYAIRPEGIFITWPRLTAFKTTYDLAKIFEPIWPISRYNVAFPEKIIENGRARSSDASLARVLLADMPLRPWESVELVNGTKLVVNASPGRHQEFADLLDQIWKLADLYVIMNARMIEVDKAFYQKHIAALFAMGSATERPEVVLVNESLFKILAEQKALIVSDDAKLPLQRESVFLSRQTRFRFTPATEQTTTSDNFGIEGISFLADPSVSADRRYIRLQITRRVEELIGSKKQTVDDPEGNQKDIESPDIRTTTASATVQIPDEAAILMHADFRPVGHSSEEKVRLILARPYIWLPREMAERGIPKVSSYSPTLWTGDFHFEDPDRTSSQSVPATSAAKEILQAVVADVLTNPHLKATRDFYGTPGQEKFTLDDQLSIAWPKEWKPNIASQKLVDSKPSPFSNAPHLLGLRLGSFNDKPNETDLNEGAIEIRFYNAGGSSNGIVCGHSSASYSLQRSGNKWIARLERFGSP